MRRGSILILALVTIMILSIMAIAGLTVTSIENETTANFYRSKQAFYVAVEGVEQMRALMKDLDADDIAALEKSIIDTKIIGYGNNYTAYITGSLKDLEDNISNPMEIFEGFNPTHLSGSSVENTGTGVVPVIWYLPITAKKTTGKRTSYSEIQTGILGIVKSGN